MFTIRFSLHTLSAECLSSNAVHDLLFCASLQVNAGLHLSHFLRHTHLSGREGDCHLLVVNDDNIGSLNVDAHSRMTDGHGDGQTLFVFKDVVFTECEIVTEFLVVDGERMEDKRKGEAIVVNVSWSESEKW